MKELLTESEIIRSWEGSVKKPLVSICCITYNHELYIEDALIGFLSQKTNFSFEVLVHDDASSDSTADIIRKYQMLYPSIIKPIFQIENKYSKNIRINPAFNFPRAVGKYIALCDGDDYWNDASKLQVQKDFLDNNLEYVICYTDIIPFNNEGVLNTDFGGAHDDLSAVELQKATSIYTLTAFFRNLINEWPPELYNVKYGDIALWSLLGDHGKGKYLPEVNPSMYRVHNQSLHSSKNRLHQLEMRLQTLMSLYSLRLNRGQNKIAVLYLEEIISISNELLGVNHFKMVLKALYAKLHNLFRISG
ncbi:glycosyltransferase family 2 protein [Amphritea balenae]|uniref:Glycosyltransferase n=1 Tax=Amphritea balenae TaxID=452629 RepID=A0A3P1SPV7_9GAMM|nr:glycosyltransferase [Amphritea balenae]RRC99186.1 glycosyltransferase [Amphritea balenae]GGK73243.1 glycosyl transferase [Amphritea balenae]